MPNYDFHTLLEPLEFEKLVCDIVQVRENINIEMYKEGRDKGIDGSYTNEGKKTIIQAKRYQQNFKILKNELKRNELPKVRKLKPDRYILGVSIEFLQGQKEEIVTMFEGYIVDTEDIISRTDINRLLELPKFKWVELAHPKLWQPSSNVLEQIVKQSVNRAIYRESTEELKEAIKKAAAFAPTRIYRKALQNWLNNHVIVISGEPGVGKTTIGYMLALANLQPNHLDGFIWANSINDVYAMLEDDKKQVIILDDFWGSIFHDERISYGNNESRLDKLIKRIAESKGQKKLILTTREYVLQQGLQKHPQLEETMKKYAFICTVEDYSDVEKANILYRQLYSSNLEYEYVEYLYWKSDWVVAKENYNPRVLSLFLHKEIHEECSPEDYYDQLCDYFDNPDAFWQDVFKDFSHEAQLVAMILLISSTPMKVSDMECCYNKYIQISSNPIAMKDLGSCIAELEKTMLRSFYDEDEEGVLLKFSSPAVQDYLYDYIFNRPEQSIPIILQCCCFYNQLQFLLEYFSAHCSNKTIDLITDQCILHYHDYQDSSMGYDGSWNWEIDFINGEEHQHLHKFFHLLRCCIPETHPRLFKFLESEIHSYCKTMGSGDKKAQYIDLANIPDIIVRCVKNGMNFLGNEIIIVFFEEAFSAHHYIAMQEFKKVFPNDYALFYSRNYSQIKNDLVDTLLCEIEFLEDYNMDFQLDMLIDNLPETLKEFGIRNYRAMANQIYNIIGIDPVIKPHKKRKLNNAYKDTIDDEKQSFENNKENAQDWLFGPTQTDLEEDEITLLISDSSLEPTMKETLKHILETASPQHVYNQLQTPESINFLIAVIIENEGQLPKLEYHIHINILRYLSKNNSELLAQLLGFCLEAFMLFMYREEPVVRMEHFKSSEAYVNYLQDNETLRNIIFNHLSLHDEKWIRFLHIPTFIFCYAFILCKDIMSEPLEEWQDVRGENSIKLKRKTKFNGKIESSVLYSEYGTYYFKRSDWEGSMYRMCEELTPFHFNKFFVEPRIKNYLNQLGYQDDSLKVLNHLSLCQLKYEFKQSGNPKYSLYCVSDELNMVECLGITEGWDPYPEKISNLRWRQIKECKDICKKEEDGWTLLVYNIKDISLLKELGIYQEVIKFIKQLENVISRFSNNDYSRIERELIS